MEKQEFAHLETIKTHTSNVGDEEKLENVDTNLTLAKVDLENKHAFKGDDSDGKIDWSIRKLLASAFLAMLYTGTVSLFPPSSHYIIEIIGYILTRDA